MELPQIDKDGGQQSVVSFQQSAYMLMESPFSNIQDIDVKLNREERRGMRNAIWESWSGAA